MKVFQSADARKDIERIYSFGITTYGENAAEKYIAGIVKMYRFLAEWPMINQERWEIRPPVRIHNHKGHLIVYRLHIDQLQILRVLGRKQNWPDEM
jgi:toxin ParE1/3/4